MQLRFRLLFLLSATLLSGCFSTEVILDLPSGEKKSIFFYTGSNNLPDLLIIDGQHHTGKAQFQINDPLGDIGFRLDSGQRVQAECVEIGKNVIGEDECKRYQVYRSSFGAIPEMTEANRPSPY